MLKLREVVASDIYNRRVVIILCNVFSAVFCLILIFISGDKLFNLNALHMLLDINVFQNLKLITYAGTTKLYFFIIITIRKTTNSKMYYCCYGCCN